MTDARGPGLFLDLDGTLADNLPSMYQAYLAFLASYGRTGTPEEFRGLNGPPLAEVVRRLQATHGLEDSLEACEERYQRLVDEAYQAARARTGAAELLRAARERGLVVAVVTSNHSARARAWLERVGLWEGVDVLVGGERGGPGKPDPAPYLEALARTGCAAERSLALEDSPAGAEAALRAGLETWTVGEVPGPFPGGVRGHLASFEDALPLLPAARQPREEGTPAFRVLPLRPDCRLEVGSPWRTPGPLRPQVDALWKAEKARRGRRLTNGRVYALADATPERLLLRPARYRPYLARRLDPSLGQAGLKLVVVGVTGVLLCRDGVVLGRRATGVALDSGLWEPAPSGSLPRPDPRGQILAELREELGLGEDAVEESRVCGLVEDFRAGVADLVFLLRSPRSGAEVEGAYRANRTWEYDELAVVPLAELPAFLEGHRAGLLPVTRPMLELAGLPVGPG